MQNKQKLNYPCHPKKQKNSLENTESSQSICYLTDSQICNPLFTNESINEVEMYLLSPDSSLNINLLGSTEEEEEKEEEKEQEEEIQGSNKKRKRKRKPHNGSQQVLFQIKEVLKRVNFVLDPIFQRKKLQQIIDSVELQFQLRKMIKNGSLQSSIKKSSAKQPQKNKNLRILKIISNFFDEVDSIFGQPPSQSKIQNSSFLNTKYLLEASNIEINTHTFDKLFKQA